MAVSVIHGDSREVLTRFPSGHFDSVITDPPYALVSIGKRFGADDAAPARSAGPSGVYARASAGFMGQKWDTGESAHSVDFWREVLRVLKPGGHVIAAGGTRTYHRLAVAIEDAGFEIRDAYHWIYGTGFPKSHNAGDGWGTALKPAVEPWVIARRPLDGTVAANRARHGTGALNVDACRIPMSSADADEIAARITGFNNTRSIGGAGAFFGGQTMDRSVYSSALGRWPANLGHDGSAEVVERFPAQAGAAAPVRGTEPSAITAGVYGARERVPGAFHGDSGSAARFFYCAKASPLERVGQCRVCAVRYRGRRACSCVGEDGRPAIRTHPTVKPLALMAMLARLVTPAGGLILDPFAGTGTTGEAAAAEGFGAVLIERDADFVADMVYRLAGG